MKIEKTYIYANSQVIAQHDGNSSDPRYFCLHDRLGSVRMVIDTSADVKNFYTYNPFGELFTTDSEENVSNPFKFTGQYLDSETGHYYLRARQYSPYLSRFITRDLIDGKFEEPMTLHKYLYCTNNPINMIDPIGLDAYLFFYPGGGPVLRTRWGSVVADGSSLGHISVGVDDIENGKVSTRSAAFGQLDLIDTYSLEETVKTFTNNSGIYVTFKNKEYKRSSSDSRIRSYLHKTIRPHLDTLYPYCSNYAQAALQYGGYNMDETDKKFDIRISAGISPKALMSEAIERAIQGDANIGVSRNALLWYLTEADWTKRGQFTEAWLNE